MTLVSKAFKDLFVENILVGLFEDICWVGRFMMDPAACDGLVAGNGYVIADMLG